MYESFNGKKGFYFQTFHHTHCLSKESIKHIRLDPRLSQHYIWTTVFGEGLRQIFEIILPSATIKNKITFYLQKNPNKINSLNGKEKRKTIKIRKMIWLKFPLHSKFRKFANFLVNFHLNSNLKKTMDIFKSIRYVRLNTHSLKNVEKVNTNVHLLSLAWKTDLITRRNRDWPIKLRPNRTRLSCDCFPLHEQ